MTSPSYEEKLLHRRRVLVVEDDFLIADDFARRLIAQGAEIIGPAATIEGALEALDAAGEIDFAVLDINLRGVFVFPFAQYIAARGIPFFFCTGYGEDPVSNQFRDISRFEKPLSHQGFAEMVQLAANLMDRRDVDFAEC